MITFEAADMIWDSFKLIFFYLENLSEQMISFTRLKFMLIQFFKYKSYAFIVLKGVLNEQLQLNDEASQLTEIFDSDKMDTSFSPIEEIIRKLPREQLAGDGTGTILFQ